jgi:hypothetical protein
MTEPSTAFSRHQRALLIVTCVGTFMTLLDKTHTCMSTPVFQHPSDGPGRVSTSPLRLCVVPGLEPDPATDERDREQ